MNDPAIPVVYVTRLVELFWAGVLVAATMGIHGLGMIWSLRVDSAVKARIGQRPSCAAGLINLILVSWSLVIVHVVVIVIVHVVVIVYCVICKPGSSSIFCE